MTTNNINSDQTINTDSAYYNPGRKLLRKLPETFLEEYTITEELSDHDSSFVFRCKNSIDDASYIAKLIPKNNFSHDYYNKLTKIKCPMLCTPTNKYINDYYVILIFDNLTPLTKLIESNSVTKSTLLGYFNNVLEAIIVLHRNGLTHKDISIPNMLIKEALNVAALCDFPYDNYNNAKSSNNAKTSNSEKSSNNAKSSNNRLILQNELFQLDSLYEAFDFNISILIKLEENLIDINSSEWDDILSALEEINYKIYEEFNKEFDNENVFSEDIILSQKIQNIIYKKTEKISDNIGPETIENTRFKTPSKPTKKHSKIIINMPSITSKFLKLKRPKFRYIFLWIFLIISTFFIAFNAPVFSKKSALKTTQKKVSTSPNKNENISEDTSADFSNSKLESITSLPKDKLSKKFADSVNILYLHDNFLKSTDGIAAFTYISELYLSNNKLENLDELSGLNSLKILVLNDNPIKDLSPIKELINLTYLDISDTDISDISVLSNFSELKFLNLHGTKISEESLNNFTSNHPDCQIII
ncbi:MAG: hypothetical protein K6D02_04210 [Lachnospiraceae bacterium]|nr:hypothetical protein [Lachnospiraceae bacterium]